MQKRFKLKTKDSVASSLRSQSPLSPKEVSRDVRGDGISQIDFSITPLSGFRDITNFTNGDSSLNLQNMRKNLQQAKNLVRKNKQDLKKNLNRAKKFDENVKKSRVSSAKAELQSIRSEFTEKDESEDKEESNKLSKLRFSQKSIGFKGNLTRNKSTKSDSSKSEPSSRRYPQSQPVKNLIISDEKINTELKKAVMLETGDLYKEDTENDAQNQVKRRFTDAVQSLPHPPVFPKRIFNRSKEIVRTRVKISLIKEYQASMNLQPRLVRITIPAHRTKERSSRHYLDRVRYPRLLKWLNETVIDVAKDSILVRRVPF